MNGIREERLWRLGGEIRSPLRAIAAVELPVSSVLATGLRCSPDPLPGFDEHGVIVGWDPEEKGKRLSIQQDLAAAHTAVHRPPSSGETNE
jgi:hypothetical protein